MKHNLYKEWYECKDEKEMEERYKELVEKGYYGWDIIRFRYQGNDGKFHREIYVWKD